MDFLAKVMVRDTDKSYSEIKKAKINTNNNKINKNNPLKNSGKEKHTL